MKADFDFTTNVEKYMYMINKAKRIDVDKITIPQSGLIRKVLFKHMTK